MISPLYHNIKRINPFLALSLHTVEGQENGRAGGWKGRKMEKGQEDERAGGWKSKRMEGHEDERT